MKATYQVTMQEAAVLGAEFVRNEQRRKGVFRILGWAALTIAILYALIAHPTVYCSGSSCPALSVWLAIAIQVPIVTGLAYLVLRLLFDLPARTVVVGVRRQPADFWGERELAVTGNGVSLRRGGTTFTCDAGYVTDTVESKSGYHLKHDAQYLFAIPRHVCDLAELRAALGLPPVTT